MRQLTDVEKQQLAGKITKEQERQQTLRKVNREANWEFIPTLRKVNREANWEFIPNPWKYGFFEHLWNSGFLGIILWLLARSIFYSWPNFDFDKFVSISLLLALLFNQIALFLTKTGWKSRVMKTAMKTAAWVWIVWVIALFIIRTSWNT